MSMIGSFLMVTESTLQDYIQDPEKLVELLYGEGEEDPQTPDPHYDVDKTWQMIHFLLTGDSYEGKPPERNVIFGVNVLSDEVDVGYGPASFLTTAEVKEVHHFLKGLFAEELWSRFDREAIRKVNVYPDHWTGDDEDREYVTDYYLDLVGFYARAAENNLCVIQYIS
ncbi:YfbM family protein [Leptospira interrogans]|uniref:YfbM family protein n=1 Tax=Leptospira interrogans TaxID=173 RepID=UPI000772F2AC|nr:YfbM family protein [Leptospira interrogans]